MGLYPKRGNGKVQGENGAASVNEAFRAHYQASPVVEDDDRIKVDTALPASGTTTVTTFNAQPDVPRNVTVKGNEAGITGNVVVNGVRGNKTIQDTIALNGATKVAGAKIFDRITSVVLPTRNAGTNVVRIGVGSKLGLSHKLDHNTVDLAYLNKVKEGTLPVVTVSASAIESNGFTLNSALDGNRVDVYYWI